ncbi:BUD13 homolog [Pseudonaja textilis]|uniref:BUD13 homolog n=1 Tax=Pseudonaja textilis TaxID=8673 RepID=UPI000EA9A2E4|nr:BUD13 homolog [Pseudonaja textilis]
MAAASSLSKAEYLRRRYLEGSDAEAGKKRRRKKRAAAAGGRMRIVDDDDVSWKSRPAEEPEEEEEADESDLPVVAEFIDERPDEVKWMETFRASNKWKLLGDQDEEPQLFGCSATTTSTSSSESSRTNQKKHLLDQSPPRRNRHAQPDLSPKREPSAGGTNHVKGSSGSQRELFSGKRSAGQKYKAAAEAPVSLPFKKASRAEGDLLPPRSNLQPQPTAASARKRQRHDSECSSGSSPTRRRAQATSDSDLSPPRATGQPGTRRPNSPSDLSPPRRNRHKSSDSDLSPPRRGAGRKSRSPSRVLPRHQAMESNGSSQRMLSGGKAGLVSADLLRREQQERKKAGRSNNSKHLEEESRHAKTVFRDEMGRKRDLRQERLEQRKRAEEKSERDEQYAKWGKGLAQSRQQQQNVDDAVKEMQKPLARYIDDQDLDQMLREQEREGDPMADFMRKKKAAAKERQGAKEKPKYNGPAPPLNRFNIWPGYRWDGVDRSNGFEKKRFARIASKKATQELAYKWSVEDM